MEEKSGNGPNPLILPTKIFMASALFRGKEQWAGDVH
jgi:hypothetical protein